MSTSVNMNPTDKYEYQYVCRVKTSRNETNINEIISAAADDGWIVDKFIQESDGDYTKYAPVYISILFKRKLN